jgi:hypothetical protein
MENQDTQRRQELLVFYISTSTIAASQIRCEIRLIRRVMVRHVGLN